MTLNKIKLVLTNQMEYLNKIHDLEESAFQHEATGNYEAAALEYAEIDYYSRIFSMSDNLIEHESRSLQIEYALEAVNGKVDKHKIAQLFDCTLEDLEQIIDEHCQCVAKRINEAKTIQINSYTA